MSASILTDDLKHSKKGQESSTIQALLPQVIAIPDIIEKTVTDAHARAQPHINGVHARIAGHEPAYSADLGDVVPYLGFFSSVTELQGGAAGRTRCCPSFR